MEGFRDVIVGALGFILGTIALRLWHKSGNLRGFFKKIPEPLWFVLAIIFVPSLMLVVFAAMSLVYGVTVSLIDFLIPGFKNLLTESAKTGS